MRLKILIVFSFSSFLFAQVTENDGNWASKDTVMYNTPEAEIMVRSGDIDNLRFGWPTNFDPFSGNNTPSHGYPWTPDTTDPSGTDRIMVPTSYNGSPPHGRDGYTSGTSRPGNIVSPITLRYNLNGTIVTSAVIQMFVDDFQAPVWWADYEVRFNGIRIPLMESIINELVQTGPIGKIISARIPNEFLYLLKKDSLEILIDDFTTGAGDGFAIDFAKLLINPKEIAQIAGISGKISDFSTGLPLDSVKVVANGVAFAYSDSLGNYSIDSVLAGLVSVQTYKKGYGSQVKSTSVVTGSNAIVNFSLKTPAPVIIKHTPLDSAYSITADSTIQIWFGSAIDTNTIKTFTLYLTDSIGVVSGHYIKMDSSVIFVPDSLKMNNEYSVTLTTGISDLNGIALEKEQSWRFFTYDEPIPVGIGQRGINKFPAEFSLDPAYPNPFNPQTMISYKLKKSGKLKLFVYAANGKLVKELINGYQQAGNYSQSFDASGLASGLYYIRLQFKGNAFTCKVVFIK
ncbi:MAG: Ig-like domain-containing protein [Calditrichaeota bacterium]|nr:Ig-like domain-containing protein [Calditrichota bacterium]